MKKFFSIGEAAEQVHMTAETLRHYDRIGLVKPSKVDPHTKFLSYRVFCFKTARALAWAGPLCYT